jgi:hypothetical protein
MTDHPSAAAPAAAPSAIAPASPPASDVTLLPGRPAIMAPAKVRRVPRRPPRERTPFLHDHPLAHHTLKGHTE